MAKKKTEKTDFEIYSAIEEERASGVAISKACKDNDRCVQWYYNFKAKNFNNQEVVELSTRARENRADYYFDKCEETLDELKEQKIDSSTGRVLFDGYLRLACKANQRMYGDKQEIQHSGSINVMPCVQIDGVDLEFDIGENVN